ncbi:Phytochrome-like protein cph2 [Candidatus Izimaplasma bacterium HR1]|jgi:diguanylate cyclase (GGDEF)-like protein|uniref:GGDEF domain-containing protein n=1 Tax=Candidatus Izimoplasma sp. HR1 TaxID=1541959 RepID=UPI0004F66794|nr:Phytochrome-like protein cph2 [Candidatus Izimaplasma bacterium HR1]
METMLKNTEKQFIDNLTGLRDLKGLFHDFGKRDLDGLHFIYVDIDDFNKMNIIFGVDTVDDMLKGVADTLRNYCGKSDVYRVGNDQFLLVTDRSVFCEHSELQRILKQPFKHHHIQYVINASVCVADYDDFKGDNLKQIVNLLRITVDLSKNLGRNTLIYAHQKHKKRYEVIQEIENNIYYAMRKKQFYPKYRPFVDTFTNEIIGFEAVSRWDLNGRTLKPYEFLEIAQWTGIIYELEMWVFEQAMEFYRQLSDDKTIKLSKRFKAGVNLSEYTLITVEIDTIIQILTKFDISAKDVIIEIKESYIRDKHVYQKVHNLYELGFVIILDDYSNASSSLTYLADLKVDVLKLSEKLLLEVNNSEEYTNMKSVYEFFVDISKKFQLSVVSTGIRNKKDLKLVKELGVNMATGDYFSRAIVKEEFLEYMQNNKKRKLRL